MCRNNLVSISQKDKKKQKKNSTSGLLKYGNYITTKLLLADAVMNYPSSPGAIIDPLSEAWTE